MKSLFRVVFFVFSCMGLFFDFSYGFDIKSLLGGVASGEKNLGLFLSDVESRKQQLEELENEKELFEKRILESLKTIGNELDVIEADVKNVENEKRDASGNIVELLDKKKVLLHERKQILVTLRELWKETKEKIVGHIKLVGEVIDFLEGKGGASDKQIIDYSWKAFSETKEKDDQLAGELAAQELKKERLKKLRIVTKDEINSYKKQLDTKNTEKEKLTSEQADLSEKEEAEFSVVELDLKVNIVGHEIEHLREKIELGEFKTENLIREEKWLDDQTFLLKQKKGETGNLLSKIQINLNVMDKDVKDAKADADSEEKGAVERKNRIAKEREAKKIKQDAVNKIVNELEKKLDQIKETGEEKGVDYYIVEALLLKARNQKLAIDRELDLLETQKKYSDVMVQLKKLKAQIIEVAQTLKISKDKLDEWQINFREKKKIADGAKKLSKDKQEEIVASISEINKEIEGLKARQKEIKEQKDGVFKRKTKKYYEGLEALEGTVYALGNQKIVIDRHFSKISELLLRQKEVIDQYNFIIKHLESQRLVKIWKRSSRAISFEQIVQFGCEGESFFKSLFWDTPTYLSPIGIFQLIRQFYWFDYLGIVLFVLLLLLFLACMKMLLVLLHNNVKQWIMAAFGRTYNLFAKGVESFIAFLLNHLGLIFGWFFVYLHVSFGCNYFKPLTSTYSIALFYLASIPILVYLSRMFILKLKDLNQELSFIFVSEKFQNKFTILVEIFLYASSFLLPLRKAFLSYIESESVFTEVLLAIYTVILVIVVLFFFDKEDVLRILSSKNPIVSWLREKADYYYYPVFAFFVLLIVLVNPYVGYSNLAWSLVFTVPASIFLFYGLFFLHFLIRKYSLFFFIKEEDEEVIDKFEYAKTYYGFFISLAFVFLSLITFVMLARIWGVTGYTLDALWKSLSEEWVWGTKEKFGFVEVMKLGLFVAGGFVTSSLIGKFILGKLFVVFRTEPGAQNTISKILHYIIIAFSIILGLVAINLAPYALGVAGALIIGIGFGLQNQIADYFAGFLVLLERPIEIGHYVETNGIRGTVKRISARATTIRTARNFYITIPNRDLISMPVINWGQGRYPVGCELDISIDYEVDPEMVREVLFEVIKNNATVLRVPAPVVRFEGFGESGLLFYVRAYISARKVTDMWDVQSDLRFAIIKAFKAHHIKIPYPQMVVRFPNKKGEIKNPIELKLDKTS